MTVIKKNDFIEVEYTGKIKKEDIIFDTTNEETAKKAGLEQSITKFGPISICVGAKHLLPGLETFLEGKEIGDYTVEVKPEEAFGKKDAKLLQMVSRSKFLKERINPQPGLVVEVDGQRGLIKTVTGGRVIVDFNHPLSGKELVYDIKVNKIINDIKENIKTLIEMRFKFIPLLNFEVKDKKAELIIKDINMPTEILKLLEDEIKNHTDITDVIITPEKKKENSKTEKKEEIINDKEKKIDSNLETDIEEKEELSAEIDIKKE
jgi:FKBP-type peptidyl-prolyl cis-trans isomerase 2